MAKQKAQASEATADNTNEEKKGGEKSKNPLHAGLFNVKYEVNGASGRCKVTIETNDKFDVSKHGDWCDDGEVYANTLRDFATAVEAVEAKIAELCE